MVVVLGRHPHVPTNSWHILTHSIYARKKGKNRQKAIIDYHRIFLPQEVYRFCIGIPSYFQGFIFHLFQGFHPIVGGDLFHKKPRIAPPLRFWSIVAVTAFEAENKKTNHPAFCSNATWGKVVVTVVTMRLVRIQMSYAMNNSWQLMKDMNDGDFFRLKSTERTILGGFVAGFYAILFWSCRRTAPCGCWCWCGVTACLAIRDLNWCKPVL